MEAAVAREHLALAQGCRLAVRRHDRMKLGLGLVALGLAFLASIVLRPSPWAVFVLIGTVNVWVFVNATLRTKPRVPVRMWVSIVAACLAWVAIDALWLLDASLESGSVRWASGGVAGTPLVAFGLLMLRAPRP